MAQGSSGAVLMVGALAFLTRRTITSTSGTCNHLTLSSWPGEFRAVPTALCFQWLSMIPSSGFLLALKLHSSCPYYWLRHLLEKSFIRCSEEVCPAWKLAFWAGSTEVVKDAWKLVSELSAGDTPGSFWLIWKQQREDQPEITPQEWNSPGTILLTDLFRNTANSGCVPSLSKSSKEQMSWSG